VRKIHKKLLSIARATLAAVSIFCLACAGGRVKAIPGGADKIRTFHPTLAIFDEFSYMEDAEQCWNAATPACQQMIGIGTAHPGWMADQCCDPGEPFKPEPMAQVRPQPYVTDRREVWER
jgi:hypothetical protein